MARTMRLQISPVLLYFLVIIQCFAAQEFRLDSQGICGSTVSQTPLCLQQNVEFEFGGDIELNCSESNIRIGYPKNLGLLQYDASDITRRSLGEIRLECTDQHETAARINCSINMTSIGQKLPNPMSEDLEEYIISNITEVEILTGFTCYVSGCYSYLIRGRSSPLIVLSQENCTIAAFPKFVNANISITATVQSEVILPCDIIPNPTVIFTWQFGGMLISPRGETYTILPNGSLVVANVGEVHEGTYTCMVTSPLGVASGTVILAVNTLPTVTADSATVVTIEGHTVSLICNATGDPVPVQTWSRNGKELMSGGKYQISSDGRVLMVQGVMEAQDEGEFTCHASNVAGNDSATIMLSVQEDAAAAMNSYVVLFGSMIPVSLTLLFIIMLLIIIILVVLRYKKHQKVRARHALFVLDDKDMVFNPNHTPPVCVHKPPLNFSHRKISVISVDLIQNLTHSDNMAVTVSSEKHDMTITTDNPGEPPHYMYAVQNSIKESDDVLMISGNTTECNIPEQSVELPAISSDAHSGSVMQLTSEAGVSESTTRGSLNAQNSTLTQDNSVEYGDTLQLGLMSVNNQIPATGTVGDDNNIDRKEPFTASDYHPSNFNRSSIVASRPGDMIQLDQSANIECNGVDSLSQSTNYIVLGPQKNHQGQQMSVTSLTDTNAMLEDNTMNVLDAINTSESPISGQLPSTCSTNDQLNIINEHDQELDMGGCVNTGQLPPISTRLWRNSDDIIELDSAAANISTLVVTASQEDALSFDSERGSLLSLDLTGDIPEPLKYLDQLAMNHNRTLSDSGYL